MFLSNTTHLHPRRFSWLRSQSLSVSVIVFERKSEIDIERVVEEDRATFASPTRPHTQSEWKFIFLHNFVVRLPFFNCFIKNYCCNSKSFPLIVARRRTRTPYILSNKRAYNVMVKWEMYHSPLVLFVIRNVLYTYIQNAHQTLSCIQLCATELSKLHGVKQWRKIERKRMILQTT